MVGRSATMSGIHIPHPLGARRAFGARPVQSTGQVHPAPPGLSNDRAAGAGRGAARKTDMADQIDRTTPDLDVLDDTAEVFALLSNTGRLHPLWILSNDEADGST